MIAFQVVDMTTHRCAGAITKALKACDHSAQVRADLATFTVEVEPSHATARELGDAIRAAGYSPVEMAGSRGPGEAELLAAEMAEAAAAPTGDAHGYTTLLAPMAGAATHRTGVAAMHARTPHDATLPSTWAVSKVGLDADGRITSLLWGQVDTVANAWAGAEVLALVAEVVAVLHAGDEVRALFPATHGHVHDRSFMVADYDDGRETIVLDGPTAFEREVHDMDRLA